MLLLPTNCSRALVADTVAILSPLGATGRHGPAREHDSMCGQQLLDLGILAIMASQLQSLDCPVRRPARTRWSTPLIQVGTCTSPLEGPRTCSRPRCSYSRSWRCGTTYRSSCSHGDGSSACSFYRKSSPKPPSLTTRYALHPHHLYEPTLTTALVRARAVVSPPGRSGRSRQHSLAHVCQPDRVRARSRRYATPPPRAHILILWSIVSALCSCMSVCRCAGHV